jgi:hypothetical protein
MNAPRNLSALCVAVSVFLLFPAIANAEVTEWDHNGSLVRLEQKDKKVKLVYAQPRDGLGTAGVKQGTVLFDGEEKSDGRLAGYAKLFRKGCDPVDYFVEGSRDKTKGEILLQGQAPIYAGDGCKITGYTDEGSASSLKFTMQSTGGGYGDQAQQDAEPRGYLPPPSISGPGNGDTASDDPQPRERADPAPQPRGREQADTEPRPDERDYADRGDRYEAERRYDGQVYPRPRPDEPRDYDDDDDDYDEEPAYIPFQPWWRGY